MLRMRLSPHRLNRKWWLFIGILTAVVVSIIFIILPNKDERRTHTEPPNNQEVYKTNLNDLILGINQLEVLLNSRQEMALNIRSYNILIDEISGACQEMMNRYDNLQKESAKDSLKDAASEVKQLCNDLFAVLEHARLVALATDNYLLIDTVKWHGSSDPAVKSLLDSVQGIVNTSIQQLERVSVPGVSDPGIKEQITLLGQTEEIIKSINSIPVGTDDEARRLKNSLHETIERHKSNLWDARNYYWRNTVQIKALEKKLRELESRF